MSLSLHWFLPTHGDGHEIGQTKNDVAAARSVRRGPDLGYLRQVAQAADRFGFDSVLVPAGLFCEDPWLVAAALSRDTEQLGFMVAFRPGLLSPTLAAQMTATGQRITGGRLNLNVVAGGDADEQQRFGDWLEHDDRYRRADEFLTIMRGALAGEDVDFSGEHYQVAKATVKRRPDSDPCWFLGGSSASAQRVAARHADVYLAWGEPPNRFSSLLDSARTVAASAGRELQYGTRFNVIARDTADEAWSDARRLVVDMDPSMVEAARRRFAQSESEGQRRMLALHDGALDGLEISPNVWAGYGLARPGAGLALVGSHEQVADRIVEYHKLGVDHLILSGQPHLEEAYRFGEGVLPQLQKRGVL